MINYNPIYTMEELSAIFRSTESEILELVYSGQLPYIQIGENVRFRGRDVEQFINTRTSL